MGRPGLAVGAMSNKATIAGRDGDLGLLHFLELGAPSPASENSLETRIKCRENTHALQRRREREVGVRGEVKKRVKYEVEGEIDLLLCDEIDAS